MRFFLFACLLAAALPARAQSPAFTPDQRSQIVRIVRDALKADPSILRDAATALQADDAAREQAEQTARIEERRHALEADPEDQVAGNPAGDVTVVEFYDPRCPYCRRVLPAIEQLLRKDHGIRWVYKDIPVLGQASTLEARAILAARKQGGYLKMQAALMGDPSEPSERMIHDTAKGLGLDPARLASDMGAAAITGKLQQNIDLAHALHIDGTPIFVVGDTVIPGAVDAAALELAAAAARKKG